MPELYSDEGLDLLKRMAAAESRPQVRQQLDVFLQIHQRCQGQGLQAAFAELERATVSGRPSTGSRVAAELRALAEEIERLSRPSEMPRKVELCERALGMVEREDNPVLWGALQGELANALQQNPLGNRAENLEKAIHHYQQALEVYARQAYPQDWAMTQNNLATAYLYRIRGEGAENLEQAIFHYQQALEVYTRQAYPVECRGTARNWGNLAFEQGNWQLACTAYTEAWLAQEVLLRSASLRPNKEMELREMGDIPARLAFAQIRLAQARQALTTLESGRAQLMREALERNRRDLERLAEIGQQDLLDRYRAVDERVETLQRLAAAGNRPPDWLAQMEQAQAEWNAVIEEIRRLRGYETFLRSLTAEQIQEQAGDAPLVYLAATQHGGFALLVRGQGEPRVVELPQLTEKSLQKQVIGDEEQDTYLRAYLAWRADQYNDRKRANWQAALDNTCEWLWEQVMQPLLEALQEFLPPESRVILIPSGWLALLPLHAAWTPDETRPYRRRYALDEFTFTYAPSALALMHARLAAARPVDSLLAVQYPDPRFQFAEQAVQAALAVFAGGDNKLLQKEQASKQAVREAFNHHAVLFFFTHGMANFEQPLRSGLQMVGGDSWLTLEDIFALRGERARLAVLAACESGVPADLRLLEEGVSLPSGLMQAGIPGVVGSLWSVFEVSTSILMTIFFEQWRNKGLSAPAALRQAQRILRDARYDPAAKNYFKESLPEHTLSPASVADILHKFMQLDDFAHPFYWAAFTYTGL